LCDENCSFVSGHAAGGFVWMAWGMWRGRRLRQRWLWTGMTAGALIGATRVMQGGHFLSDIVFSGWFIWLTYQLIRNTWLRYRCVRIKRHAALGV
ncbi:MAG: phosphatase PAP2 family protein, partial [Limnohabitans sp.]